MIAGWSPTFLCVVVGYLLLNQELVVLLVVGDFPTFIQNKRRWGGQCGSLKRGLPYGLPGDP